MNLSKNGELFYPEQPDDPPTGLPNPSVLPAFNGDVIVVNGMYDTVISWNTRITK